MPDRPQSGWFAPKRFGYGSSLPIAWQGWVALAAFIVSFIAAVTLLSGAWRIVVAVLCTLIFCVICAVTTQGGWRWRWGDHE